MVESAPADERRGTALPELAARPFLAPAPQPRLLDADTQEWICEWRRRTGWGARLVAGKVGRHHSTVWKVLARHDTSRPERAPREEAPRYELPCPSDLLHMDTSRYARFERPGHAVTGDRSQSSRRWMDPKTRVGYDFCRAIVDDHSRLAYVELHPDEKAATVTAFVERALAFFASHGIESKRLMTDHAFAYAKNRSLHELLTAEGIKHLLTQPYCPQTNGKVEHFHQTMAREWAYGMAYRSHRHRSKALPHWLRHYKRDQAHGSIGGRPPISRVHNVLMELRQWRARASVRAAPSGAALKYTHYTFRLLF